MYYRFQFDILSDKNPMEIFLNEEIPKILSDQENEILVLASIGIPGIMLFDSNIPVFLFFNDCDIDSGEEICNDKKRFLVFCSYLKERYKNVPMLKDKHLKYYGFMVREYILSLDYIIINKGFFDNYIVGKGDTSDLNYGYKSMFENAYAEFMINKNLFKILKENPSFQVSKFDFFEENTKTKLDLFEHYIKKYGFQRFMNYEKLGSFEGVDFIKCFL